MVAAMVALEPDVLAAVGERYGAAGTGKEVAAFPTHQERCVGSAVQE